MERRILVLIFAAWTVASSLKAQSSDFGIWAEADVEKKISKDLSLNSTLELRTRDNGSEQDRWGLSLGAEYKLTSWLKASAGYTLLADHNHKVNSSGKKYADYWGLRHRFNVSLTASQQLGRLGITLRERWQYTYRPEKTVDRYWNYTDDDDDRYQGALADEHTYGGTGKNVWRNRLQLKYKLNKTWRPYVAAESFVSGGGLDKVRLFAGSEIRLSKQHSLDAKYIFQNAGNNNEDVDKCHIFSIGYSFKF